MRKPLISWTIPLLAAVWVSVLAPHFLLGQDRIILKNFNYTYVPNIQTVQFHPLDNEIGFPILPFRGTSRLRLAFDDLDAGARAYTYSIVHCDKDWNPSQLGDMEFMDGFPQEIIVDYLFSVNTLIPYTHYELVLPNDRLSWTKSGNYLLHIFNSEGKNPIPVITRRFVVVDDKVRINVVKRVPNVVEKSQTHHEYDFTVDHQDMRIRNPQQELFAVVLQNGRWDNAIYDLRPLVANSQESTFDYQDKVVFPAGKEWRFMDIRSLLTRSQMIANIERFADHFEVELYPDLPRNEQVYLFRMDANGAFVVDNFDRNLNPITSADYADVLFILRTGSALNDKEVYLFGALSEWLPKEEYRMRYNPAINSYVGKAMLKQGYYEYGYAALDLAGKDTMPSLSEIEGDSFETQNEYTILIYYRPFGGRYDQLIGAITFSTFL